MNTKALREFLLEHSPETVTLGTGEEFDHCIIGTFQRKGEPVVILYSTKKVVEKLQTEGYSKEEAEEHLEYSIIDSWYGSGTPAFLAEDAEYMERRPEPKHSELLMFLHNVFFHPMIGVLRALSFIPGLSFLRACADKLHDASLTNPDL